MLRSVLVALDGSPYSETATALALDWAGRFGAQLLGLGVLDEPSMHKGEALPMGASAYKKVRDEARISDARHRIESFLSQFKTRCAGAGVPSEVVEDIGDPAERILREAHRSDVVLLARETHFHFETQDRADDVLGRILRSSPRPVAVVPRELPAGHGVIIAYGGGREAARTLQVFQLLGLADGEDVEILTVDRDAAAAEATASLAGDYLSAHGTSHRLHPIASHMAPAGIILDQVKHRRPRLLVMGAHGHHPVRDLFSTSVTRAVLSACPVPVFVGA